MRLYTVEQIKEFLDFVKRHNITFNNVTEVESAIAQYFIEE
jgi:hypothetical protein